MKKHIVWLCLATAVVFVFALSLCVASLTTPVFAYENKLKIVLDAGHGGIDGGVVGRKTGKKESEINLSIVMLLKEELENAGFEVVLTRKTEGGLYGVATNGFKRRDMQKRKEIIEAEEPSLVVSVHQNFYSSASVRGGQVFYETGNVEGEELAKCLQNKLNELYKKEGVGERKEKSGEYYVLSCGEAPVVIAECGFLSNVKDEALLVSDNGKKRIASALFSGILSYFEKISG